MELFWMRKRRLMANTFNYSGLFAAHNDTCVISWFNLEKDQFLIQSESGATHSHSASSHWIWNCRVLSGEILKMYILSLQGHDWCKKGASTKTARLHPATILKVVFPIWRRKILFCRVNNISTRLYAVIYVDWRLGKKNTRRRLDSCAVNVGSALCPIPCISQIKQIFFSCRVVDWEDIFSHTRV